MTAPLTGEALEREQMRRNQRRWRTPRLHFNRFMLTAKCPCECGLKFTTKGIAVFLANQPAQAVAA